MNEEFLEGINAVPGIAVGHDTDLESATGCTAILACDGAAAGVDVRGAAPATRETDLLAPWATVDRIHGILLTGGSAFGLAAATGVVDCLEMQGIGHAFGGSVVPIIPAAALFDLSIGDGKTRPNREAGWRAARAAMESKSGIRLEEGNAGAGTGATIGKAFGIERAMKGGLGTFCHRFPDGSRVGALAAVNAFGDVFDPRTGRRLAGCRFQPNEPAASAHEALLAGGKGTILQGGQSTTLAAVATDIALDKAQCTQVARMAHDGLARTISPAHTPLDGDIVFVLSTCRRPAALPLTAIGHAAAHAVATAILRGVRLARTLAGIPGLSNDQWA